MSTSGSTQDGMHVAAETGEDEPQSSATATSAKNQRPSSNALRWLVQHLLEQQPRGLLRPSLVHAAGAAHTASSKWTYADARAILDLLCRIGALDAATASQLVYIDSKNVLRVRPEIVSPDNIPVLDTKDVLASESCVFVSIVTVVADGACALVFFHAELREHGYFLKEKAEVDDELARSHADGAIPVTARVATHASHAMATPSTSDIQVARKITNYLEGMRVGFPKSCDFA